MQSYYILQTFAIQFIQILIILIYALAYYPVMPENQIAKKHSLPFPHLTDYDYLCSPNPKRDLGLESNKRNDHVFTMRNSRITERR